MTSTLWATAMAALSLPRRRAVERGQHPFKGQANRSGYHLAHRAVVLVEALDWHPRCQGVDRGGQELVCFHGECLSYMVGDYGHDNRP
jgi:hypothetical protein